MSETVIENLPTTFFPGAVQGIAAFLEDNDERIKVSILKKIEPLIDTYWSQIAESLIAIEALAEDESFPERNLAAYLASKCYYHLEEYGTALALALNSGDYFNIDRHDEYIEKMMFHCINEYTDRRQRLVNGEQDIEIDPRMEKVVETMIQRAIDTKQYGEAIGLSIDSRRLDKVEECIVASNSVDSIEYIYNLTQTINTKKIFRNELYNLCARLLFTVPESDYCILCNCLEHLERTDDISQLLIQLINNNKVEIALQLAFDIYSHANHQLIMPLCIKLREYQQSNNNNNNTIVNLLRILDGSFPHDQQLSFLWRNNHSDMLIMKELKDGVEKSSSVLNHATIIAHSIMNCGTTNESFLRNNQAWLKKSTLWSQFSAVASIGVIHRGHVDKSKDVLGAYISSGNGPFCEGGALYALGIIHSNSTGNDHGITKVILDHVNASTNTTVINGGCLGFGLVNIASGDQNLINKCKDIYSTDDAISGEAAGYSLGLLLCSLATKSEVYGNIIQDMLAYAHETEHEKIIRGLSMGVALSLYGNEEDADIIIQNMIMDSDPVIRYGGAYGIGLAYCGTGNNKAIQQLLHIAVSDVNDDVRRAAVTNLGFIMIRNQEQLPYLVSLLSESYNAYVRYGACIALGIACCNTHNDYAIKLLTPMLDDKADFVRQGAFIAMSMLLVQNNNIKSKAAKQFRKKITETITDERSKRIIPTFGMIIASGILDVGGRNCNIQLLSAGDEFLKMDSIIGLTIGLQYWYWYPLIHCMSLAYHPTTMIGVNSNLQIPSSFTLICNNKQSTFEYPKPRVIKEEVVNKQLQTTELSTTKLLKAKQEGKSGETPNSTPKTDTPTTEKPKEEKPPTKEEEKKDEKSKDEKDDEDKPPADEPDFFTLNNPCRVCYSQLDYLVVDPLSRYTTAVDSTKRKLRDFVVLIDKKPELGTDTMISVLDPNDELQPPESFEWVKPPYVNEKEAKTAETPKTISK